MKTAKLPLLYALCCVWLMLSAGCTKAPPPVNYVPGATVETLTSQVTISAKGGKQSGSARGYLVYKRPDRLHLLFLSPFGSSVFDLFLQGEEVTCLFPDKMLAYTGPASDLSSRDYLATLKLMRWVLARPPVPSKGARELVTEEGERERVFFYPNGLVQRKLANSGAEVTYRDYRMVDGIPFPERMEISDGKGGHVRISFEEPEVNRPVEESALVPKLTAYTVLPLSLLQAAP